MVWSSQLESVDFSTTSAIRACRREDKNRDRREMITESKYKEIRDNYLSIECSPVYRERKREGERGNDEDKKKRGMNLLFWSRNFETLAVSRGQGQSEPAGTG